MRSVFSKKKQEKPLEVEENIAVMVHKVVRSYPRNEETINALDDVSFSVKKGEIFSIVGRSGSGKTTLLNVIGTMEQPTSGRIALNGKTIDVLDQGEITDLRRTGIATIYQNYNLIPVLSAFQNVELPMILTGMSKEARKARAIKLLEIVGLGDRLDHKPDELSGGEKQRVTIARALSNRPSIILADEPTGDLDHEIAEEIVNLIEGINRDLQTTLILVTHDRTLAQRADRILELRGGKILKLSNGDGANIRDGEKKTRTKRSADYY